MQVRKQQLELDMEQTGSKQEKEQPYPKQEKEQSYFTYPEIKISKNINHSCIIKWGAFKKKTKKLDYSRQGCQLKKSAQPKG